MDRCTQIYWRLTALMQVTQDTAQRPDDDGDRSTAQAGTAIRVASSEGLLNDFVAS
jgi:hypothetical protein